METQFDTSANEQVRGVAIDGRGRVTVAGITDGSVAEDNAGSFDIFIRMFAPDGRSSDDLPR